MIINHQPAVNAALLLAAWPPGMNKLYTGEIDRLIIFAGPSGSGKTSFLKNPLTNLGSENLPPSIADFHTLAPKHRNIMGLWKVKKPRLKNLCLHVDLTQPTRWLPPTPRSREALLDSICPQMFSDWQELACYSERASEIHVITFFVRREENFRRWTGRVLKTNPNGGLKRALVAVNGDSTNRSELHRKVYSAWQDFIEVLSPISSHIIDGNGESYSFLSQAEYETEISTGYRSWPISPEHQNMASRPTFSIRGLKT